MPITEIKTNFTAGEVSPRMLGRVDIDRYANGAEVMENVQSLIHGGARRRPGLRYISAAKNADKACRVVPFVFSTSTAYILEMGDQYTRFYKDMTRIGAPYEVATPIVEANLFKFEYVQGADTMFATLSSIAPQRIRRFGDASWSVDAIPFDPMPFDEIGHSFSATLTLSAATVGSARTATASSGIFLNGDVGRQIIYGGGVFKITGFTSTTQVTGDITSAFDSVNVPADLWTLDGSPQESITPSAKDPLETTITLTSAALNIWRSTDVGKFVRINGGLCQITQFTTALVVNAVIKQVLTATVAAPKNSWSLEASVWSAGNGYPGACTLFQQRLILAGSTALPQTVWGSSVGSYIDYTLGSNDSDAFAYTVASDQINPIMHMASAKILFALTYGGEFTIKGGVEKPITPTNVQVERQSAYGANTVRPLVAGKDLLFVQRAGLKVRAIGYDASDEDFDAEDMTLLAEHITGDGIVDLSYNQEPDPFVYAVRADGVVASGTVARKQQVTAWTRLTTDGVFESVATIPVDGGEETWFVVRRTINGATVRYLEVLDDSVNTDAAITLTAVAPGATVWSGLSHLEGETVQVKADGRYMGTFTVASGQITLPRKALAVEVGLPYRWRIKLLTPEVPTATGSAQGNAMSINEVSVRFLETYDCEVNGKEVPFRRFGSSLLDTEPVAFTGVKRIENLGWDRGSADIELSGSLPFPAHVLAVVRKLTVNG